MLFKKEYTFTPSEVKAIVARINGKISEQVCADRLKINRQRVDSYIAHWIMMEVKNRNILI